MQRASAARHAAIARLMGRWPRRRHNIKVAFTLFLAILGAHDAMADNSPRDDAKCLYFAMLS